MADTGFLWRGFCSNNMHEACAKFLQSRPLFIKTMPIFECFWEKLLALPDNPFVFDQDLYRGRFLSSSPRWGGFHLACHQYFFVLGSAQRGVWFHGTLGTPLNPPLCSTYVHKLLCMPHASQCMWPTVNLIKKLEMAQSSSLNHMSNLRASWPKRISLWVSYY